MSTEQPEGGFGGSPRSNERAFVIGIVVVVLSATIGAVAYVALTGVCPNPAGTTGLSIVQAPHTVWDEQALLSIDVNETVLSTTVIPVFEQDSNGYGPVYLLNGVTDSGYWYQLGIAFDFGLTGGGYASGAEVITNIYSPGNSVTPLYALIVSVNVASGDSVTLSMSLTGGCASLSLEDPSSHLSLWENYSLEDSNHFVPGLTEVNGTGYFSGLMTEWWHANRYYGPTGHGVYTLPQRSGSFVGLGISEFIPNSGQPALFNASTRGNLLLPQTWSLSLQNVTESVNRTAFVTQ